MLTRKAQTSCTKASAWLQCHVLSQIPDGSQILWKIYLLCTAGYYSGIEIPDIFCMFQINGRLKHFDLYTFGKEIISTWISCVSNERMCEDTLYCFSESWKKLQGALFLFPMSHRVMSALESLHSSTGSSFSSSKAPCGSCKCNPFYSDFFLVSVFFF